ncbi:MAG: DUF2177 family protein [Mobilitalea sp.]
MNTFFTLQNIRNYFVSLVVFLVIDMVWLVVIAKNLYAKHLGYLMVPKVNFPAAFIFYMIFILGLLVFVINPALLKESWQSALLFGMFFGLVTYATYDLTNLATVKDWPMFITVIDLIWGSVVSGATALISYLLIKLF